jgi:hypothetical protein
MVCPMISDRSVARKRFEQLPRNTWEGAVSPVSRACALSRADFSASKLGAAKPEFTEAGLISEGSADGVAMTEAGGPLQPTTTTEIATRVQMPVTLVILMRKLWVSGSTYGYRGVP